ncbi:hypothetical protein P0F65_03795 [Sphingomonas sp. I4]
MGRRADRAGIAQQRPRGGREQGAGARHAGVRLVGYHVVDGGYIDNVRTATNDINRVLTSGLRGTLRWDVGDGWHMELGGVPSRSSHATRNMC